MGDLNNIKGYPGCFFNTKPLRWLFKLVFVRSIRGFCKIFGQSLLWTTIMVHDIKQLTSNESGTFFFPYTEMSNEHKTWPSYYHTIYCILLELAACDKQNGIQNKVIQTSDPKLQPIFIKALNKKDFPSLKLIIIINFFVEYQGQQKVRHVYVLPT